MLTPASGFYATPGLGTQEVRLAYVLKIEDLKVAIDCLEVAIKSYPGRMPIRDNEEAQKAIVY